MSYSRASVFLPSALFLTCALNAGAQSVISTRSGVVHYFEGAVTVAGRPLELHAGKFSMIPEGAELRTEQGRAEVLLTPGVILRVGEQSAIRLASNALPDTKVELLEGAVTVEAEEASPGTAVTLCYKEWNVKLLDRGAYRMDADPARLWVRTGEAEVSGAEGEPVSLTRGMSLALADKGEAERSVEAPNDGLTAWDQGRSQSIYADNAISSQISDDPATVIGADQGQDAFTYFPMLGLSSAGAIAAPGVYGSYGMVQPGFYSLYLPGYTYRPLMLLVVPGAYRSPLYAQPLHVSPGIGTNLGTPGSLSAMPHPGLTRTGGVTIPVRPAAPVVARPGAAHVGRR